MNTAPEISDAPVTPSGGRWRRVLHRRWVMWTGIAVLGGALVATAVTIPLAIAAEERNAAVDTWRTSLVDVFAANDTYVAAQTAHTTSVEAGTADVAALNAILDALPAELVDPASTRDDVAAAAAALQTAASAEVPDQGVAVLLDAPALASTGDPTAVDEATAGFSAAQLLDSAAGFRAQTADIEDRRTTLDDSTEAIEAAREGTRAPLAALVAAAVAKAPSFPIDRAGEGERATFTTSLDAVRPAATVSDATAVDVLPLVKAYADALGAARASHDAAVAAERQAQENTDGGSSSDRSSSNSGTGNSGTGNSGSGSGSSGSGSSGSNSSGGNSGGSGSGGNGSSGGNPGGNGSNGGSGSSGSGGASGPVASPIKLVVGGSCVDFPNSGQSASYGSTLYMPADAAWHETYEIPGVGWGVRWSCF